MYKIDTTLLLIMFFFNSISTFMGYLMPKAPLYKNSGVLIKP